MLLPTLFLLGLGLTAAAILAMASRVFYVWEDPRIQLIQDSLLGANCGGCGYPGCAAAANAIVAGDASLDVCSAGGFAIALRVAAVMGAEVEMKEPQIAYTSCRYGTAEADLKFSYTGVNDCRAAVLFDGGPKECPIGCVGLGSCERACPFGAISMGTKGLPVFDRSSCTACGVCVRVCPKGIIYLTSITDRIMGEYRSDECSTPCQRACPSGIDIPGYIRQIKLGNYTEAVRIIREKNPFPLTTSRICPAPCERACRRNLHDEAVAINPLKRFAADHEAGTGRWYHPYRTPATGKKAAVIGGGVQGLTAAYYLACLGHNPTVYEAAPQLGGILSFVIPGSRLPRSFLEKDIEGILDTGVQIEKGRILGKDFSINDLLKKNYDIVILCTGGHDSRSLIRGAGTIDRSIPGVYTLLDILGSVFSEEVTGKKVTIQGSGESVVKAASLCLRKGASSVTIVSSLSREEFASRSPAAENGQRLSMFYSSTIAGVNGDSEILKMVMVSNSRGELQMLESDVLIVATGRISDIALVRSSDGASLQHSDSWESIPLCGVFADNERNDLFFADPSVLYNDSLAVIASIGRGRRIARAAHLYLSKKEIHSPEKTLRRNEKVLDVTAIGDVAVTRRNTLEIAEKSTAAVGNFYTQRESSTGYTPSRAHNEADRCLDCGLICYRRKT